MFSSLYLNQQQGRLKYHLYYYKSAISDGLNFSQVLSLNHQLTLTVFIKIN
ncbi:hypothetical protein TW91_0787 [Neisseria flavescens]|nr:hypothetical protein TW91_0787 [Neisseria flavescens]